MAVNRIFGAVNVDDGLLAGSLVDISYSVLTTGDMAVVRNNTGNIINFYRYDAAVSVPGNETDPYLMSPYKVMPADAVQGSWVMVSPSYFVENLFVSPNRKVITNEIVGNDSGLSLGFEDGAIDIVIGTTDITITKLITTSAQIESTVTTGTAPFVVGSVTQVDNLNVEFHGGELITNISLLDDNTNKYSVLPQVTNAVTVYPANDADLVTKKYVDDELRQDPSDIVHEYLSGLTAPADDHTQYSHIDGRRSFTAVIRGINPTDLDTAGLTTVDYVIDKIDYSLDNTSLFLRLDGTYNASMPVGYTSNSVLSDPSFVETDFVNKYYVDFKINEELYGGGGGTGLFLRTDGTNDMSGTLVSAVSIGTAPFMVTSTTVCANLNADRLDGYHSSSFSMLDNNANKYTVLPQVSDALTVVPTVDADLVTVKYVTDAIDSIDHAQLGSLDSDDHNGPTYAYVLQDGTRWFTGKVRGISTVGGDAGATLATKDYIDGLLGTTGVTGIEVGIPGDEVGGLSNILTGAVRLWGRLSGAGAISSAPVTNETFFTEIPYLANNGANPTINPSNTYDLVHKKYVDDNLAAFFGCALLSDGSVPLRSNMSFTPKTTLDFFSTNNVNLTEIASGSYQVVGKAYVDRYIGEVLVSSNDNETGYLGGKITSKAVTSYGGTSVNPNINVAVITTDDNSITRYEIVNGSLAVMMAKLTNTRRTAVSVYTGSGTTTVDETRCVIDGSTTDAIADVSKVYGGVGYIEKSFTTGPALTGADGAHIISFSGDGDVSPIWSITVATGAIGSVGKALEGSSYTSATIDSVEGVTTTGNVVQVAGNFGGVTDWKFNILDLTGDGEVFSISLNGAPGTAPADATYNNITTSIFSGGNNGTGLILSVTVTGGVVGTFSIVTPGSGYYGSGTGMWWFMKPRITGQPLEFDIVNEGVGFATEEYKYCQDLTLDDGFTWSGVGTDGTDADDLDFNVTFVRPNKEKVQLEVKMEDVGVPGTYYTLRVNNGVLELVEV